MSGGQLFFSDKAIRTSVLGKGCSLNCHIWDLVQLNILCFSFFFFLDMPAHLSSNIDCDPLLIDSFVLSPSLSLSACLLLCFVLPSVHIENQSHPLSLSIVFCLVLSLCSVPTVVSKRRKCELFGAGNPAVRK